VVNVRKKLDQTRQEMETGTALNLEEKKQPLAKKASGGGRQRKKKLSIWKSHEVEEGGGKRNVHTFTQEHDSGKKSRKGVN